MQSYSQSKSIPTFKLHRVIITILGRNVKFLIHFFLFFLTLIHCFALSGMALAYIGVYFGGHGHVSLGAGREFWVCLGVGMVKKIFSGV